MLISSFADKLCSLAETPSAAPKIEPSNDPQSLLDALQTIQQKHESRGYRAVPFPDFVASLVRAPARSTEASTQSWSAVNAHLRSAAGKYIDTTPKLLLLMAADAGFDVWSNTSPTFIGNTALNVIADRQLLDLFTQPTTPMRYFVERLAETIDSEIRNTPTLMLGIRALNHFDDKLASEILSRCMETLGPGTKKRKHLLILAKYVLSGTAPEKDNQEHIDRELTTASVADAMSAIEAIGVYQKTLKNISKHATWLTHQTPSMLAADQVGLRKTLSQGLPFGDDEHHHASTWDCLCREKIPHLNFLLELAWANCSEHEREQLSEHLTEQQQDMYHAVDTIVDLFSKSSALYESAPRALKRLVTRRTACSISF